VEQNYGTALEWYRLAVDQSSIHRNSLIDCYLARRGITANDIKAYGTLDKEARKGCARDYLKEMTETNAQATYRFSRYLRSQVDERAQEYFDRARSMGLDRQDNYPICGYCGNVSLDVLLCGRCRRKYFCGPACIRNAWSVHRQFCSRRRKKS